MGKFILFTLCLSLSLSLPAPPPPSLVCLLVPESLTTNFPGKMNEEETFNWPVLKNPISPTILLLNLLKDCFNFSSQLRKYHFSIPSRAATSFLKLISRKIK